ncbi:MAG: hypothetical protein M5R36_14955 [Deltaproteobacteria bacterium]|nr:hypothetical protein [Deltaproteobacteria bacterium]
MSGAAKKAIQTVTVGVFFFLTFYAYAHHLTKIVTPDFFPIGQKLPPLFLSTVMLFVPPMLFLVIVAGRMIERTAGGPASFWTARVSGRAAWVVLVAIALPIFPTIVVFQSLVEPIVLPLMAAVVVASYLLKNWRPFPAIYPFVFFLALTTFLYRSVDQARPRTERIYRKTLNQQGVVPIATYSWGRADGRPYARCRGHVPGSCDPGGAHQISAALFVLPRRGSDGAVYLRDR